MKKFTIFLLFSLLFTQTVFASSQFDRILSEKIGEYGVFSGGEGIVYSAKHSLEGRESLLIVRLGGSAMRCEVYDDYDGVQLTDSIDFPYDNSGAYRLAVISAAGRDYIMFSKTIGKQTSSQTYALENDAFTEVSGIRHDSITYIAAYSNGKISLHTKSENVFRTLNTLKESTIAEYPFSNRINIISDEELQAIRTTLTACADIMSFDIKNYDYDMLFRYILYTHRNFKILCDIDPQTGSSSSLGYNNVNIVSSEYIDYIMQNIFRITPEKPLVNNLLSRGFCYSDGYYFYTGGFSKYFATELRDIAGVYDIGGGVTFVVFSDIYHEDNSSTPEYSFAILQKTGNSYSLLRLGMGENLPSAEEVRKYSPFALYNGVNWSAAGQNTGAKENSASYNALLPILLLIISIGSVAFICSIIALIKQRK